MKRLSCAFLMFFAFAGGSAFAQLEYLGGQYQCVSGCVATDPGSFAYVTQNGYSVNLVNEVGMSSRGWIDRPGHLWAEYWNIGAIFSPDGGTIQFDNGAVWQRYVPPPPPPPPVRVIVRNHYILVRHHVVHHHVVRHRPY